ncbi:MAG TPA: hypothetical protein VJ801_00255, partial [Polyangia bacterium]|nr:hypothetical protein [Polyangia bacterium]
RRLKRKGFAPLSGSNLDVPGCHRPTGAETARMKDTPTLGGYGPEVVCDEGSFHVVPDEPCDGAYVGVLNARWKVVELHHFWGKVRRMADGRLLIGMRDGVWVIEPTGKLRRILRNRSFELFGPEGCECSA